MAIWTVPNWVRIILLVLSVLSFLPQLQHIWRRQNSKGISIYYVLFNLISATEQFTLIFFLVVTNTIGSDVFVHDPPNMGDWLNLYQIALVWILLLTLFAMCLYYTSDATTRTKGAVSAIYTAFLLISIVPEFADTVSDVFKSGPKGERDSFFAMFYNVHSILIGPPVTLFSLIGVLLQIRKTLVQPSLEALSLISLACQSVVFSLVTTSWVTRVVFPVEWLGQVAFGTWYQLVGWVVIDNAIYTVGQAILTWIGIHRAHQNSSETHLAVGETQPLLGD